METTFMARAEDVEREWYVVDATGIPLGRLASTVAHILRGKHKPIYTPHVDTGDHVIVINAEKVELTGKKLDKKLDIRHSHYPGGLRTLTYREFLNRMPERAVRKAIRGMMPRNKLGRKMFRKLKVYAGSKHPHEAQQPKPFDIDRFL